MRKTYIYPESFTICLAITQHLTVSNPNVHVDPNQNVDAGSVGTKEENSSVNVWDVEW